MLPRVVRGALRTLSKGNAERVGLHLVMAGRLLDLDPELAYTHATAAVRTAGRVDVVREAVALTAYATGRYAEALREVRTVRRLAGVDLHRAIEADSERGLGRPDRALDVIAAARRQPLSAEDDVELSLVESGARADLGQHEAGRLVVEDLLERIDRPDLVARAQSVRADRLDELGLHEEAEALRAEYPPEALSQPEAEDSLVVVDLAGEETDSADEPGRQESGPAPEQAASVPAAAGQEHAPEHVPDGEHVPAGEDGPAGELGAEAVASASESVSAENEGSENEGLENESSESVSSESAVSGEESLGDASSEEARSQGAPNRDPGAPTTDAEDA